MAQIRRLTDAGCDIVRSTVPTLEAAKALKEIKKQISIPLVADIHFDHRMAIAAIENGADKIRINPGNIGGRDNLREVVAAAKDRGIPIRVGVNSGSLEKELVEKYDVLTAAEARYAELKAQAESGEPQPEDPKPHAESTPCAVCGRTHNPGNLIDVLLGRVHWWIGAVVSMTRGFARFVADDVI